MLFCLYVFCNVEPTTKRIIKSKVMENEHENMVKFIAHLMVSHAKLCAKYNISPVCNLNGIVIWLVGILNWNLNFPGWMLDGFVCGGRGSNNKITKFRHTYIHRERETGRKNMVSCCKRKRKIKSYDNFIQILFNWTKRYLSFNLFGCWIIIFLLQYYKPDHRIGICLDIHKSLPNHCSLFVFTFILSPLLMNSMS